MYTPRLCILLLFVATFFVSCKKQYSCQCSTTYEEPGYSAYTASTVVAIDSKTTKKRAGQICSHAEKQMYKNNDDYTSPSGKLTTSCAVK